MVPPELTEMTTVLTQMEISTRLLLERAEMTTALVLETETTQTQAETTTRQQPDLALQKLETRTISLLNLIRL